MWCAEWEETVRQAARATLTSVGGLADAEVSILLTDDERITAYNRDYRGIDGPTDVLSFSQREGVGGDPDDPLLGDVAISVERATAQALDFDHSLAREMGFLTVHGVLHLLGWDHQLPEDERAMMAKTEEILTMLGLVRETR
ncbi:MAG: rRNA maturation RNase YbeY [Thermaerobacter sp.]|nr:rRNA maturation RNase YbeY [Thermaerobacter sp.]